MTKEEVIKEVNNGSAPFIVPVEADPLYIATMHDGSCIIRSRDMYSDNDVLNCARSAGGQWMMWNLAENPFYKDGFWNWLLKLKVEA